MRLLVLLLTLFVATILTAQGKWPSTVDVDYAVDRYEDLKIRVKVFPHKRNYVPHMKDWKRDYIELESKEACRVYRGAEKQTAKLNSEYFLERKLKLHVINLDQPLWIECDKPALLTRSGTKGQNYEYSGAFYVYKHFNRSHSKHEITVVNVVDLETYLRGVVPSEVYTHWPMESLKSQAVAARTYALFHLNVARQPGIGAKPYHYFYDVDDTILYQAYTGLTHVHERTDLALKNTHSLVITYNNKLIQAYYHADSGGYKTESARSVWGVDVPYAVGKKEPYASKRSRTIRWKTSVTKAELSRRLLRYNVLHKGEKISWIAPIKKYVTNSSRIKKLLIKTNLGTYRRLSTKKLRRYVNLESNKFVIKATSKELTFEGRGSGHGVGMNQKGSQILAKKKGWTFDKILHYYYTSTRLCSLSLTHPDFDNCSARLEEEAVDKS